MYHLDFHLKTKSVRPEVSFDQFLGDRNGSEKGRIVCICFISIMSTKFNRWFNKLTFLIFAEISDNCIYCLLPRPHHSPSGHSGTTKNLTTHNTNTYERNTKHKNTKNTQHFQDAKSGPPTTVTNYCNQN